MAWPETDRAERAIRWIETYCILPKGYGSGATVRLAPFQKAWLREVLRPDVTSAVLGIPRGNGKSTLLAALALWALFDPDAESGAPQVPVIATTVGQAIKTVYGPAVAMVKAHPDLADRSTVYTAIGATKVVAANGGEMFPIANATDGLQGLDPTLAVVDEVGFQPMEAWSSLLLAGVKRPRCLVVGIGTPGLDKDNALWHLRSTIREGGAINGFSFTEYAADDDCDPDDEAQWFKSNPALAAGYLNLDAMRTNRRLSPESHFRVFHLGQWVDGVDSWLGPDGGNLWDALEAPWKLVSGAPTWVGVDVGLKRDSTAVVAAQRREDGRLHAVCRIWLPPDGGAVDVTDVMGYIRTLDKEYRLVGVSFDPRFFDVPAKMLEDEGLPMLEVPQSVERMTAAIGSLFEAIQRGEVTHEVDVAFRTQVLNAVPRLNERGFTLAKGKSRGRIDACIALALAMDLALRQAPPRAPVFVL